MSDFLHKRRQFLFAAAIGVAATVSCLVLISQPVIAKSSFQSGYTLEQTYSAALRMLRVDMGLKITERDPESAYVMFEYKSGESGARISSGSIEMVPQSAGIQVTVQLSQMPQYHEEVMANSLKRKLQSDYGDPPRRPTPPKPSPDAGPDADAKPKDPNEPSD